jgi:hypothetical protein
MFNHYIKAKLTKKLLVSITALIVLSLPNFWLTPDSLIAAEDNRDKATYAKNFSFHYRQYSGRYYPDEVSIFYSSDSKELIYRDSRHYEYHTFQLDDSEETILKEVIVNNGFFHMSDDLRIKCCDLTNTNLTVTISNITHTSVWNIGAPVEIYRIVYAINHMADSLIHISNSTKSRTHLVTNDNEIKKTNNNDANFFFEYSLSNGGINRTYDRILYNSNTKELIVMCNASVLLVESLCGPGKLGISHKRILDNTEENNLRQVINNNGFFDSAIPPQSPRCSNCYTETLTVKLNGTTKTIRWSLIQGVVISDAVFDTLRIINYVASK